MIIDFDHNSSGISNVNAIIAKTLEDTDMLLELNEDIPAFLAGYNTFRTILRYAKRCNDLNAALKKYSFEACPPEKAEKNMCGEKPCTECWKQFCNKYAKNVDKKNFNLPHL